MQEWDILLIGGSSAVGKSHLARQLSKYYEVPLMELDDIRIALQQVVDKKTNPRLFFFLENSNYLENFDTETLVQKLLDIGEEVWPALDKLIEKHLDCNEPVIIEGDSINPELLAKNERPKVKSIFLWDNKENILERGRKRIRGNNYNPALDDKQVDFSFAHGEALRKQAESNNFTVVPVSPIETLFERTVAILEQ
jgi:2-phosphoglycerate kinase